MPAPEAGGDTWKQVEDLFDAALTMNDRDRMAFLESTCPDAQVRNEVISLLAHHRESAQLFEASPLPAPRQGIGPYRILREIGRGGMGVVHLAERTDGTIDRKVAIKIVRPGLETHLFLERFRRELRILSGLDHPNIARMLDGGATADGLPYLVMEFIDGVSIEQWCDRNKLGVRQRVEMFLKVCDAVSEAHSSLVIHRDLKPGNILVTNEGEPKLLDFGLAKLLEQDSDEVHETTGVRMLTPLYASPEQMRGQPLTTASDVYSLGVILYVLVAGVHPMRADTSDLLAFVQAAANEEAEAPSERWNRERDTAVDQRAGLRGESPEKLRKSLRADLDNIILKALRKTARERYASSAQLAADLRRYLDGQAVLAHPDSLAYRFRKFAQRNRAAVAAGALAALSLTGGLAISLLEAGRARSEATKAEAINSFLQEMLAAADPNLQGRQVTVAQVLDRAAPRLEKDFAGQPEVQAELRATIGSTYRALGLTNEAESQLRPALAQLQKLYGERNPRYAAALLQLAEVLEAKGDFPGAIASEEQALRIAREIHGARHEEVARALGRLGATLMQRGNLEQAERALRDSVAMIESLGKAKSELAAVVMNDLAVSLGTRGQIEEAIQWHRKALAIARASYPPDHPAVANAASSLAGILPFTSAEAESLFQEAIRIRRKALGNDHPELAWTLYNYAFLLNETARVEATLRLCEEILSHRGKSLPEGNSIIAATLLLEGKAYLNRREPERAAVVLQEALALRRAGLPAGHWLIGGAESILGESLYAAGNRQQGMIHLKNGLENLRAALGPDHPQTKLAIARLKKSSIP